jgi:hypothetical protein
VALLTAFAAVWLSSCASSPSGLKREQGFHDAATNSVSFVREGVVPFLPAPWSGVVEGVLAAAMAGLGLWTRSLHARSAALEAQQRVNTAAIGANPGLQSPKEKPPNTSA